MNQFIDLNSVENNEIGVSLLNEEELMNNEGGFPPAIAIACAVGTGGAVVGVLVVGAAVGYGVYKLVDWATS